VNLLDLTGDARSLKADEFRAKHGDFFLVGVAGALRPPKRFEETKSGPASPAGQGKNIDWIIWPLRKGGGSLSLVRVTVGRTANNDVPIEDPSVSRFHAFFEPGSPSWTVKDAGSRLGTKVNGKPAATTTPLRSGDQVAFGDVELTFMDVESLVYFVDRMSPRF
jgi:hypothetical protein